MPAAGAAANDEGSRKMKVLVIGSGGREHALAWRIAKSNRVSKVFVAPGNAGTALDPNLTNVELSGNEALVEFARREDIQLTVVGPEARWLPVWWMPSVPPA
jgi:phosphoribosylamine--glycine ligase